jgi:anaerobic ribonucleoside-triphosphate reductase
MPTLKEQKEINLVKKLLNSKERNKNIIVKKLLISKMFKDPKTMVNVNAKLFLSSNHQLILVFKPLPHMAIVLMVFSTFNMINYYNSLDMCCYLTLSMWWHVTWHEC